MGEETELQLFGQKFNLLLLHFEKFGKLGVTDIEQILDSTWEPEKGQDQQHSGILVHGKNGMLIRARTINQRNLVKNVEENMTWYLQLARQVQVKLIPPSRLPCGH